MFRPKGLKFQISSPFGRRESLRYPNFYDRIRRTTKKGLINVIVIDGKAQTGKSTLAEAICKHYDPNYNLWYSLNDVFKTINQYKKSWKEGRLNECLNKWSFFDEPQIEVPRSEFWGERNMAIQNLTSSWGFLKHNLVFAMPSIKGISEMVYMNLSLRMTMRTMLDKTDNIIRKAFVKLARFNEWSNKWYWTTVEIYKVPHIEMSKEYWDRKLGNFFDDKLPRWEQSVANQNWRSGIPVFRQEYQPTAQEEWTNRLLAERDQIPT